MEFSDAYSIYKDFVQSNADMHNFRDTMLPEEYGLCGCTTNIFLVLVHALSFFRYLGYMEFSDAYSIYKDFVQSNADMHNFRDTMLPEEYGLCIIILSVPNMPRYEF